MTRLMWNAAGQRMFETGVDRGVLYVNDGPGVPWNGLISVAEAPSGGEVVPYYIDGIKYLNHASAEEFNASIEAYTYPEEFAQCDGTTPVGNGLSATQQSKKSFGMSYRTLIGNDLEGENHGYKIHLVYNATASPTTRQNTSISNTVDPFNFTWDIVTMAPTFTGYKPTAHFVIDSRETPQELLTEIENVLYGSSTTAPRLPSVPELIHMFEGYEATIFDAGFLTETYFSTYDAGHISEAQTSTIDGGSP